jgi:uncharacterized repeat protein (TIGR01451 family)
MGMFTAPGIRLFSFIRAAIIVVLLVPLMLAVPTPAQARPLGATAAEIASLTSLYNALGGPGWTNHTNWLVGDPCTNNWYGVICDRTDMNVIEISMEVNGLVGNIDAVDLTGLSYLRVLSLQRDQIAGNIGGLNLTQNPDLTELDFYGSSIGGDIRGLNVTQNPLLVEINLVYNEVGGDIGDLDITHNPLLQQLALESNQIGGDIGDLDLSANPNLSIVVLGENQIGGDIGGLDLTANPALAQLTLWQNQIEGDIGGLDLTANIVLETLYLSYNQLGGDINGLDLTHNPVLREIWLDENQVGGNIDGLDLTSNIALEHLALDHNQIGGNINGLDLTHNPNLSLLQMNLNQIGGAIDGLDLRSNTVLTQLRLENNQIGGDIGGFDLTHNPNLVDVFLSSNQIGGDPSLMDFTQNAVLWRLLLHENRINGSVPDVTATQISHSGGGISLCGWANIVRSSGNAVIDTFAETYDLSGWTSLGGCSDPLAAAAVCDGANLVVNITAGDGPFTIGGGGPALPQNGVSIGTTTLAGPGSWAGLTILETSGDAEQLRLGDFTCTLPPVSPVSITLPGSPALLDPAITKSGSPLVAKIGEAVTYTVVVSNPHSQAIDNVVVIDPVPAIFDVVNVRTARGASTVSGQTVTVTIGTLQPGEQVTITIETRGNAAAQAGPVCNTATAGSARAEGCVTLLPTQLPATGGRPVQNSLILWVAAVIGSVALGGAAFGWKRSAGT